MARNVVDNRQVAHLWANQAQDSARSHNGNFRFEGPVLYSYRTPIAVIASNSAGQRCAVYTTRRYSITTSGKHQNQIWGAARHMPTFPVDDLAIYRDGQFSPARQRESIATALAGLMESAASHRTAKGRAQRFDTYRHAVVRANEFCAFFGLATFPVPESAEMDSILTKIRAEHLERERIQAQRRAVAEEQRIAESLAKLDAWLAGENVGCSLHLPTDHMRIRDGRIETTRGAVVPLESVRRIAPLVLRIIDRGETFQSNGRRIMVGQFPLDRIDSDGTVHVGCHRFAKGEILRIARLIDATAEVTA